MAVERAKDWVVVSNTDEGSYRLECTRCDKRYEPSLPVSMNMFIAMLNAFMRDHKDCQERGGQ